MENWDKFLFWGSTEATKVENNTCQLNHQSFFHLSLTDWLHYYSRRNKIFLPLFLILFLIIITMSTLPLQYLHIHYSNYNLQNIA